MNFIGDKILLCKEMFKMKKVIVVSKTHLDLGFTDFAENIRQKYIDEFIPGAVDMANELNTDKKNFVWTTGSWLIREELKYGSEENKEKLKDALKKGNIAAHALAFTMHTELLDENLFEYGLSYIKEIDKISGRKTISAKATDVPGHTKAIIPILRRNGIKVLHVGVNGTSAVPDVPKSFLWKYGTDEIVVIYSGEYGGAYKNEYIDDILYFDHTLDNHGTGGKEAILKRLAEIQEEYPDYEVVAGTLDDYAQQIWAVRSMLPVLTVEIGDSWIHGSASDPYKSAALRTLIALKNKWLADGSLSMESDEYKSFADYLLCIAEHTGGMDVKVALNEYDNYLKSDFEKARKTNPAYKKIEKTWQEQRLYIEKACSALKEKHKKEAEEELEKLIAPQVFCDFENVAEVNKVYSFAENEISINSYGAIEHLKLSGETVMKANERACITYDSYWKEDFDYWFSTYIRNINETKAWAYADFGKPGIDELADKYMHGRFSYELKNLTVSENENRLVLLATLGIDENLTKQLGAAAFVQVKYTLFKENLEVEIIWKDKSASRLPECTMLHFYPVCDKISYTKLQRKINPFDIVKNAGRNLAAVENVVFDSVTITNCHSPLAFVGEGKILRFDNEYGKLQDGMGFVLHNNVWGTNFPLWYEDNAYFKFDIRKNS